LAQLARFFPTHRAAAREPFKGKNLTEPAAVRSRRTPAGGHAPPPLAGFFDSIGGKPMIAGTDVLPACC
jgi:hypothetical protein